MPVNEAGPGRTESQALSGQWPLTCCAHISGCTHKWVHTQVHEDVHKCTQVHTKCTRVHAGAPLLGRCTSESRVDLI